MTLSEQIEDYKRKYVNPETAKAYHDEQVEKLSAAVEKSMREYWKAHPLEEILEEKGKEI